MHVIDETVARLNIERFHKLLLAETCPERRETLAGLIQEEQQKLRLLRAAQRQPE